LHQDLVANEYRGEIMINDDNVFGSGGDALVWIIDGDCLYDIPVLTEHLAMFTESDDVLDVSEEYPDHDGITVRFIKNGEVIEDYQTSEYFGSILLSEPEVLSLFDYPYGHFVVSPNASFDGEKFIITDRNITELPAWHPKNPNAPEGYFDQF
jgi:hypothetical protein